MIRVRIKDNEFFKVRENKVYFSGKSWSTFQSIEKYKFGLLKLSRDEEIRSISLDSDLSTSPTLSGNFINEEPCLKINFVCRYRSNNHYFAYKLKALNTEELTKWIKYRLEKANREAGLTPASNSYLKIFSKKVAEEVIRKIKSKFNSEALEMCNELNLFSLHEYVLVNLNREFIREYREYPLLIYLFLAYSAMPAYRRKTQNFLYKSRNLLWSPIKIESHYPYLIKEIEVFSDVMAIIKALRDKRIKLSEVREISQETAYYVYLRTKFSHKIEVDLIEELLVLGLKMDLKVFSHLLEYVDSLLKTSKNNPILSARSAREAREKNLIDCKTVVISFLEMCSSGSLKEDKKDLAVKVLDLLLGLLKSLGYEGLVFERLEQFYNKTLILKSLVDFKTNCIRLIGVQNTEILIDMIKNE